MFYRNSVFHANSADPDQMLHSEVSDLGLHCLLITHLGVSEIKWDVIQTCWFYVKVFKNAYF